MVIRYGDSIRAYGLGILLALLTIGTMWRLVESFTLRRAIVALVIAVLSVQSLYYNAVLLFALCLAAATVTLRSPANGQTLDRFCNRRGRGRFVAALCPDDATGAIMQLHVAGTIYSLRRVGKGSGDSRVAAPIRRMVLVNSADYSSGYRSLGSVAKAGDDRGSRKRRPPPFRPGGTFAGAVCYTGFLRVLSYATKPWYYVIFVAFAATCVEMIFASVGRKEKALLVRSACALLLMGVSLVPALRWLEGRQTNADIIAARLTRIATQDELIVINPFSLWD